MILNSFVTPNGTIEVLRTPNLGVHVKRDGMLVNWDYKDWEVCRYHVNRMAGSEVWPAPDGAVGSSLVSSYSRAQSVA